jgi:hypothetical protein
LGKFGHVLGKFGHVRGKFGHVQWQVWTCPGHILGCFWQVWTCFWQVWACLKTENLAKKSMHDSQLLGSDTETLGFSFLICRGFKKSHF